MGTGGKRSSTVSKLAAHEKGRCAERQCETEFSEQQERPVDEHEKIAMAQDHLAVNA